MAKIAFSARKDPLLRNHETAEHRHAKSNDAPHGAQPAKRRDGRPATKKPATGTQADTGQATEGPAGVVAVTPAANAPRAATQQPATAAHRASRSRTTARRVQTSVSLPPAMWDTLDALATGAGCSTGELLTAIITNSMPDTPKNAVQALEGLLNTIPADEGLHEERNYRLPLELRSNLDELVSALGTRRRWRSQLIRATVTAATPQSSDDARELVTSRQIAAMRASLAAPAD